MQKTGVAAFLIWAAVLGMTRTAGDVCAETRHPRKVILSLSQSSDTEVSALLHKIYTEAFGRLGMRFEFSHFPPKRSSMMSDQGITDGEGWRIHDYGNAHPTVIRVETPTIPVRFMAYRRTGAETGTFSGWESLKNRGLTVNSRRGVHGTTSKLLENGFVQDKNWYLVDSSKAGLLMLKAGRSDLFLDVDWAALHAMNAYGIPDIEECGVMEEVVSYLYLHEKNRSLVPEMDRILKAMHEEGIIGKWVREIRQKQIPVPGTPEP